MSIRWWPSRAGGDSEVRDWPNPLLETGCGAGRRGDRAVARGRRRRRKLTPVGRAFGYMVLGLAPVAALWLSGLIFELSTFPSRLSEAPLIWQERQTLVGHASVVIALVVGMGLLAAEILLWKPSQETAFLAAAAVVVFVLVAALDHLTNGTAAYSDRLVVSSGTLANETVPFDDMNYVTFSCRGTRWHGRRGQRRLVRYDFHLADGRMYRLENDGVQPEAWLAAIRGLDADLSRANVPRRPVDASQLERCPGRWLRYFESRDRPEIEAFIAAR
jgi:hypothetical protein